MLKPPGGSPLTRQEKPLPPAASAFLRLLLRQGAQGVPLAPDVEAGAAAAAPSPAAVVAPVEDARRAGMPDASADPGPSSPMGPRATDAAGRYQQTRGDLMEQLQAAQEAARRRVEQAGARAYEMPQAPAAMSLPQMPRRDLGRESERALQAGGVAALLAALTNRDAIIPAVGGTLQGVQAGQERRFLTEMEQAQAAQEQARLMQQDAFNRFRIDADRVEGQMRRDERADALGLRADEIGIGALAGQIDDLDRMRAQELSQGAQDIARAGVEARAAEDDRRLLEGVILSIAPEQRAAYIATLPEERLARLGYTRETLGALSGIQKALPPGQLPPQEKARRDRLAAELSDLRIRMRNPANVGGYPQMAARYREIDRALGGPGTVPPPPAELTPYQRRQLENADRNFGLAEDREARIAAGGASGGAGGAGGGVDAAEVRRARTLYASRQEDLARATNALQTLREFRARGLNASGEAQTAPEEGDALSALIQSKAREVETLRTQQQATERYIRRMEEQAATGANFRPPVVTSASSGRDAARQAGVAEFIGVRCGQNGCVRAVNRILDAKGLPLPVRTESVPALERALDAPGSGWARVPAAQAGPLDIVTIESRVSPSGRHAMIASGAGWAIGNRSASSGIVPQRIPAGAVAWRFTGRPTAPKPLHHSVTQKRDPAGKFTPPKQAQKARTAKAKPQAPARPPARPQSDFMRRITGQATNDDLARQAGL